MGIGQDVERMHREKNVFHSFDPGDAGTLKIDKFNGYIPLKSGGSAETRVLPNPHSPGMRVVLHMVTDGGGDITVSAENGFDQAGADEAVFADAGDKLALYSVIDEGTSNFRWEVDEGNVGSVSVS